MASSPGHSTAAEPATALDDTSRAPRSAPDLIELPKDTAAQDLPDPLLSSWSVSSDKILGASESADRVFPVRSAIKVDPTQTPFGHPGAAPRKSLDQEYFTKPPDSANPSPASKAWPEPGGTSDGPGEDNTQAPQQASQRINEIRHPPRVNSPLSNTSAKYGGGSRMRLFSDASSAISADQTDSASYAGTEKTNSISETRTPADDGSITSGLVTARFKHIVTTDGHAVITGRDGETLQRCEDEPIHIPGAVQGFGLLVALEEQHEGQLTVRIVSENSQRIIGYSPKDLFKLDSFCDILSEEQQDNLLDHVDFIRDEDADPAGNGPEVFTITIRAPHSKRSQKLWCAMHISPANANLIICEFELDDDQLHPLVPQDEELARWQPEDTLQSTPTEEELVESTHPISKPLRVLRSARKRKGEAAAMEVFNIMSQVQEQLAAAPNLDQFLKILVGVIKELTGFHRVMVYQFDSMFNGRVVTELVDPRATKDLYKGLNFPASDIPKQARDLYKINKVRLLYDRELETARLVCRTVDDLETPLDLSYSYLRAMSPIHLKYLANMAVRSSMSISINAFGELWGLVSCHGYGAKGLRVSFPIRKMCRLVGDTASRNIEKLSYASRLQARKLINTVPTDANPSGYIIASSDDLLKLFDADTGLLSIRGETKILGKLEHSQEALAMLEYLRLRRMTSVTTSQDIKVDFPDLIYNPGFKSIAGLLIVPLSSEGSDFIVFFRKGGIREVKWAGNPYEKFVKEGTEGYLEPRKSFKTWSEIVVGKCREWTEEQVETAAVLCLVYGKFIEVWRQKEAALHSSQLTRLLIANSAHEVRTPLNAIINYLEIALEGALDQETRDNLSKSHSASKSLIYVINDLLDLTKTEEGQDLIKDEVFNLTETIREATESFSGDAKRKGLEYEIIEHPGMPELVHGDQRRVRQVVSNIVANAIKNTPSGWIHIEMWLNEINDSKVTIEIAVEDSGTGMSNEKLDALFRDLEQVTTDQDDNFDEAKQASHMLSDKESRTLGLGLAIVARIVRTMDGQLRLKSEEGKGSRFVVQLTFVLPDDGNFQVRTKDERGSISASSFVSSPGAPPTPPPVLEGEVTLVDKSSSLRSEGVIRKRSIEEIHSLRSFKSGSSGGRSNRSRSSQKSDVDRLIDAITSTPVEVESDNNSTQHSGSVHKRGIGSSSARGSLSIAQDYQGKLQRTQSYGSGETLPEHLRTTIVGPTGTEYVQDNLTPIKAIKMPGNFSNDTRPEKSSSSSSTPRVLFNVPSPEEERIRPLNVDHLQILVAEDDPVNSKIIKKRLERGGHEVYHTINGEECAGAHGEQPGFFDVVLMDMQMPIVDGLTATKMIRSSEKTHSGGKMSLRASKNGRIPIFAVSASLIERERQTYIDAGFDGWILKPIDFKRLNVLLSGIVHDGDRNSCLYEPGNWERGGWFTSRQPCVFDAHTTPSGESPVSQPPQVGPEDVQPDVNSLGSSDSGSVTPKNELKKTFVVDERLEQEGTGTSRGASPLQRWKSSSKWNGA